VGERFIIGSLLGLALALILSGAANIALVHDDVCIETYQTSRRAFQGHSCLSNASRWELAAMARGPAAAGDRESQSFASWVIVPLVYSLLGGLLAQLPTRNALIGAVISQVLIFIALAVMAFAALYIV
jgi:ABC-type antimicrobial peptide transport system permease subunit